MKDGITRTVETVNETLSNGKTQQKQTITETSRQMVGGVLKDIKTVTSIAADGTKTVKQTMETVRETAKTVTSTFETLADGVKTTTQTVTETLTDGTETQKQVITEVYDDVVDGALVTVEKIKTVAADGTVQVAETTKKSAADTFDGLWKELQIEADTGVLGTFDDLYTAVKNQDWLSIGKWVASTIYGGLTADQKKQVNDFALGIVTKLNKALGGARDQLVQGAIDLGGQIVNGLTGGFSEVWQQAQGLGSTLIEIFGGLKTPLSNAALAISQGMKGGLISAFPEILASLGGLIGSIGGAFVAMLDAIAAALFPTGFGTPQALLMIAAGVALAAVIAGIVASIGGSFSKKGSSGRGSSSGGSSGSGGMGSVDITTGTGSLEDAINANTKALEKTNSALADMIRQAGALVLSDNMRLGSTVAASGTAQVVSAANSYHREGDTNITRELLQRPRHRSRTAAGSPLGSRQGQGPQTMKEDTVFFKDHLKIVTDAGAVLHLGWDYDAPYFLDPLNGVDVDLQTAQGVNQIGDTVEGQSVSGVSRNPVGRVLGQDALTRARAFYQKAASSPKAPSILATTTFTRFDRCPKIALFFQLHAGPAL